jgi:hypothetical protein
LKKLGAAVLFVFLRYNMLGFCFVVLFSDDPCNDGAPFRTEGNSEILRINLLWRAYDTAMAVSNLSGEMTQSA